MLRCLSGVSGGLKRADKEQTWRDHRTGQRLLHAQLCLPARALPIMLLAGNVP